MEVVFKKAWFAPDAHLIRPSTEPQTVPDEWRTRLPSSTEIVGSDPAPSDELGQDALDATRAFKDALRDEAERNSNETSAAHAAQNAAAEADKVKRAAKEKK